MRLGVLESAEQETGEGEKEADGQGRNEEKGMRNEE
jgi:hypothetical protein